MASFVTSVLALQTFALGLSRDPRAMIIRQTVFIPSLLASARADVVRSIHAAPIIYRPNPRFEAELARQPEFKAFMQGAAEESLAKARAAAPVGTGAYRDSLRVVSDEDGWRLESTDIAAHLIEWGSANNPPWAPLRRGVMAAGMWLMEEPR